MTAIDTYKTTSPRARNQGSLTLHRFTDSVFVSSKASASTMAAASVLLSALAVLGVQGQEEKTIKSTLYYSDSTFFSTSYMPYHSTLNIYEGHGDLWPTTWADDDVIYTANGDGRGFSPDPDDWRDTVVNRIFGTPEAGITGERLAAGDDLGHVWGDPDVYNRKPTGIVAVDGDRDGKDELYLVVQDLNKANESNKAFNDAPAASILRSADYGVTWTATEKPMFSDYVFTTLWFLDYGKSNQHAAVLGAQNADYVYAYGLDNNWRDSVADTVPDPQDLWLARAPIASIQDIATWEWFSGSADQPAWSPDISSRRAVLHDERRVYAGGFTADGFSVLSQGSVVYNAPLERYIYSSWTDYTFDLYEAPQPWGPWKLFEWKDFGVTPWWGNDYPHPKNGGYATTIPSKWISGDGLKMWMQSNWFVGTVNEGDANNYCLSLREIWVNKFAPGQGSDVPAVNVEDAVPLCKSAHYGHLEYLSDGEKTGEDSWDGSQKDVDRWGYTWPQQQKMNHVTYTTGDTFEDGGWFAANLTVQIRQEFEWKEVSGLKMTPEYPYDKTAVPNKVYEFWFDEVAADGVQIIGVPGGTATFTSISELKVGYDK